MNPSKKLTALRALMQREGISAFITPSTDPHAGEYIPERWKSRAWISGFHGSAGIAVVTADKAAVWTDSRYFIAAAEQLSGSEFVLMKEKMEGTPSQAEWLASLLPQGSVVAVDGWVNTVESVEDMRAQLAAYGLMLRTDIDPYAEIWEDRPSIPNGKVFVHSLKFAGETATSKLARIREKLDGKALLASTLEEVAWTLNLRCDDVAYTPFLVSYLLITPDSATLFINKEKLTPEVEAYLAEHQVGIDTYESVKAAVSSCQYDIVLQPSKTNYAVYSAAKRPVREDSPVGHLLMFKNATEIAGYRCAMEKDGVAMVKWIKWTLENVPKGGQTELSLSDKLDSFRAEQEHFKGLSFENMMAYMDHAASPHFELTPENDAPVKAEGLLLIDSGGQYLDGTTDITRTIPLGPLTDIMRRNYTLCLKGWIRLASAVFPKGTNGTQLDAFARMAMWKYGINYLHGTGHGVGQFMSVHESIDLHQFRMQWRPTPLMPGMTITDEPGIYIEGSHGIRHENTMLVVNANFSDKMGKAASTAGKPYDGEEAQGEVYGPYYAFEQLTLCPVITWPIMTELLDTEEREWFNQYQQDVYDRLSPRLDDEHRKWLREVTMAI